MGLMKLVEKNNLIWKQSRSVQRILSTGDQPVFCGLVLGRGLFGLILTGSEMGGEGGFLISISYSSRLIRMFVSSALRKLYAIQVWLTDAGWCFGYSVRRVLQTRRSTSYASLRFSSVSTRFSLLPFCWISTHGFHRASAGRLGIVETKE